MYCMRIVGKSIKNATGVGIVGSSGDFSIQSQAWSQGAKFENEKMKNFHESCVCNTRLKHLKSTWTWDGNSNLTQLKNKRAIGVPNSAADFVVILEVCARVIYILNAGLKSVYLSFLTPKNYQRLKDEFDSSNHVFNIHLLNIIGR